MAMTSKTSTVSRHQLIECCHGTLPGSSQNTIQTATTSSIKNTAVKHDAQPAALNQLLKRALKPPADFLSPFLPLASFFLSAALSAAFASAMSHARSLQWT